MPQILARRVLCKVGAQQTLDRFRNLSCRATITYGPRNALIQTERAAETEVVRVHHAAIDFDLLAFDSNVGDPMLSATVRTTCDVQLQVLIETGQTLFQFFHQPPGKALCLGNRELAEFRS